MSSQEMALKTSFRERAKANDVPVARLIAFEATDVSDGACHRHPVSWTAACKSDGHTPWWDSLRHC
jgi:hypothetical protein